MPPAMTSTCAKRDGETGKQPTFNLIGVRPVSVS